MTILRAFFALAVLAAVAASATFAFEFGWTRGATEVHRWTYALAAVALDLLKCALPMLAAAAWRSREHLRATTCWAVFAVLTTLSLWCAYGMTATQLAERLAVRTAAGAAQMNRQAALDALRGERQRLPVFAPTTEEGVEAAKAAVAAAEAARVAECEKRGPRCRERETEEGVRRTELVRAIVDRTATEAVARLDNRVSEAERALAAVDFAAATMVADPLSSSMAKASGADEALIAALSHALFALAVELGSGVGLWLVFGHALHTDTSRQILDMRAPRAADGRMNPRDKTRAVAEHLERGAHVRAFFLDAVRPAPGQRIAAAQMISAYQSWCRDRGLEPLSATMFGRLAPWHKERIGGRVWYLGAHLSRPLAASPAADPCFRKRRPELRS